MRFFEVARWFVFCGILFSLWSADVHSEGVLEKPPTGILLPSLFKDVEVIAGWCLLAAAVENCSGTFVSHAIEESGQSTPVDRRDFRKKGDSISSEAWARDGSGTLVPYKTICSNPRYFFGLRSTLSEGTGEPWTVLDVQQQVTNLRWNYVVQLERDSGALGFVSASHAICGFPLWELVEDETFVLTNVRHVDHDRKIVSADFSWKIPDDLALPPGAGAGLEVNGFIELNTQKYWRVERLGLRVTHNRGGNNPVSVYVDDYLEYSETESGVPYVVEMARHYSSDGYGKKSFPVIVSKVLDIDFTPVPDREFTLSHYGFPEPNFGDRRPSPVRYALMVIGMLMIAYALWRMYKKRNETML